MKQATSNVSLVNFAKYDFFKLLESILIKDSYRLNLKLNRELTQLRTQPPLIEILCNSVRGFEKYKS